MRSSTAEGLRRSVFVHGFDQVLMSVLDLDLDFTDLMCRLKRLCFSLKRNPLALAWIRGLPEVSWTFRLP